MSLQLAEIGQRSVKKMKEERPHGVHKERARDKEYNGKILRFSSLSPFHPIKNPLANLLTKPSISDSEYENKNKGKRLGFF